jgi:hypothetical protein
MDQTVEGLGQPKWQEGVVELKKIVLAAHEQAEGLGDVIRDTIKS